MDSEPVSNPYQAEPQESLHETADTQRSAASIARWQRIMAAFLLTAAILMLGLLAFSAMMSSADGAPMPAAIGPLFCMSVAVLFCYALPAVLLWRSAQSTREYSRAANSLTLLHFLHSQLVFWRTLGIILLLFMGLWLAIMFVGVLGFGLGFGFIATSMGMLAG